MITFNKNLKKHIVSKNKTLKATIKLETDYQGVKFVDIYPEGFSLPNDTNNIRIYKTNFESFSEQRIRAFISLNFGTELGEALFYYIAETCFNLKLTEKVLFT